MKKFNKKLSQLEAVYQVAGPVVEQAEPLQISDFIHHVFENQESYGVNWSLGPAQFVTTDDIFNLLEQRGHIVSKQVITEGIEIYKDEQS